MLVTKPWVQFVFFLSLMAATTVLMDGPSSCCGTPTTTSSYSSQTLIGQTLTGSSIDTPNKGPFQPGATVDLQLKANYADGKATFVWTPPAGATGFSFPDLEPEPGGPPFRFVNVYSFEANAGIEVSYNAPPLQPGAKFSDQINVNLDGQESSSTTRHEIASAGGSSSVPGQTEMRPAVQPARRTAATSAWMTRRYVDIYDTALDAATCQQYVTLGQSSDMFLATRLPVADAILPDTSYSLPMIQSGDQTGMRFIIESGPSKLELPLKMRADASQWANTNLPAQDGALWVAVGLDQQQNITCPPFNVPSTQSWSMIVDLLYDYSTRPDKCVGCVLTQYACYKPQPGAAGTAAALMARVMTGGTGWVQTFADGQLCIGPNQTNLIEHQQGANNWTMNAFSLTTQALPGDPLDIKFEFMNGAAVEGTFNVSVVSDLTGSSWNLYYAQAQDMNLPDLNRPISGTMTIPANTFTLIHALSSVPAGAGGMYTVSMNVSTAASGWNPSSATGISNLLITTLTAPVSPTAAVKLLNSVSPANPAAGQNVVYSLKVINDGEKNLSGLVISDLLPAGLTYVSCGGADSCALVSGTITWNLASLGTGMSRTLTLTVTVPAGATNGTEYTNTGGAVQTTEGASANGNSLKITVGGGQKSIFLPMIEKR